MKKIIWISSYPKSGNTWLRFVLANYFYNIDNQDSDLNILDKIDKFPPYDLLKNIANEEYLINNPYNVSSYWNIIQKKITTEIKEPFVFFKNHNALVKIGNYELTNQLYSLAAIYLVRDPRDVLASYLKFDKTLHKQQVIDRLTNEKLYCHVSKKNIFDIEVLGSWKFNYISWRDGVSEVPKIIIKYEDLLNDPFNTFKKIFVFILKIINEDLNLEKLNFSIKQASFDRLQKLENKFGFKESPHKFFNSGKSNNWENILNKKEISFINNSFKNEMSELEYI